MEIWLKYPTEPLKGQGVGKFIFQCFFWKKPCLLTQNLLCSKTFLRERKHFASEHKCFVSKQMFCKWTVSREIQKFCIRTQMFYKQKQSFTSKNKVSWGMQKFCKQTNILQVKKNYLQVKHVLWVNSFWENTNVLQAKTVSQSFSSENISWVMQKFCQQTNVLLVNSFWGNANIFASERFANVFQAKTTFLGEQKFREQTNVLQAIKCFSGNAQFLQANKYFVSQQFLWECNIFCKRTNVLQINVLKAKTKFLRKC